MSTTASAAHRPADIGAALRRFLASRGVDLSSSPVRLRILGALLVLCTIVAGVVMTTAVASRQRAASAVASSSDRQMLQAGELYAALSDADATAAATFATGGIEPIARRQRYLGDVRSASTELAALAAEAGGSSDAQAVSVLATGLPTYSGLVETARTNNLQGLPVGAAYMRRASEIMREQLLPAAQQLYSREARRLADDYATGTATGSVIAFIVVAVLLVAALLAAQVYLLRRTHRILNVPIAIATALALVLLIVGIVGIVSEQNALSAAQRDGSDSVEVLTAVRILGLREQGDESLALLGRGSGAAYLTDFAAVDGALGSAGGGGLVGEAASLARRTASTGAVDAVSSDLQRYEAIHAQVAADEQAGQFAKADALAVGPSAGEAILGARLNTELERGITSAQARFDANAADSTSQLSVTTVAIPGVAVVIVILVLLGLRPRLNEYR